MKSKNFKDKKLRDQVWEKTGWGKVANWYDSTIKVSNSTQNSLILPELLKFLPNSSVKDRRIIDLGCGTGFFLKAYFQDSDLNMPDKSLGIDIDNELLELAKENLRQEVLSERVAFMQGDVTDMKNVGDRSFDIALSVLSIPNIKDLKFFAKEVFRVLEVGGKFVAVINHPSFRIPQSSDWYFDKEKQKQGRVVYKYMTPHTIKIDMNPGSSKKEKKISTYTFHRPFEEYFNTFIKAGLTPTFMKEICSQKQSEKGSRQKAEDNARKEIPMFLFLEFKKHVL